jgi:hypothetical protein
MSPAQAQEAETGYSLVYHNIAIYKIRDYKDAYIITYARHDKGVGQLIVPKNWAKQTPVKLTVRNLPKQLDPYMSLYYTPTGFDHITLTLPASRSNRVWGVLPGNDFGDNSNITTLEKFEY